MGKAIIVLCSAIMIMVTDRPADAGIRCADDIITLGNTTSEVRMKLDKCGTLLDREIIRKEKVGKKDRDHVESARKIEQWYIRVVERGGMYCYPLIFQEGQLQRIGTWRKCDP